MEDTDQTHIRDAGFWTRALHMVLFVIAYSIAELILGVVILVQFLTILFTRRASEPLLRFGNALATYVRQIFRFLTYNSEQMPYPFADWPDDAAEGERWRRPAEPAATQTGATPTAATAPGENTATTTERAAEPEAPQQPRPDGSA